VGFPDAFVVKLSPSGGHLWSTYLGGGGSDEGSGIAADAAGNALVTGQTWSYGWVSGGWDTMNAGSGDAFAAKVLISPTVNAWYSLAVHRRGVGEVPLEIPDDGMFSEPRTGGAAKLLVEFSEAIDPAAFVPASVRIAGNHVNGQAVDLSGITVSTSTAEGDTLGVIEFTPALPDVARYLVQIEGVMDEAGNPLAGDNDRVFTAIGGDALGHLRVNAIDLSYIWANRAFPIDGVTESQTRSHVNCDGRVNAIDLSAAWARRGANMQNVPDPLVPGKRDGAAASGEVLALLFSPTPGSLKAGTPTVSRSETWLASPVFGVADLPRALPVRPGASAGVVTVPIETGALELRPAAPAAAVDAELPDVLTLAKLMAL
jgi:hypothetical protein